MSDRSARTIRRATMAGLDVETYGDDLANDAPVVVLLHGYDGFPSDLSPFAASFALPARFVFPAGIVALDGSARGGRAWWPIDATARAEAIARGERRDLSNASPAGLPAARDALERLLGDVSARTRTVIVGGFSQGAIVSCDTALRTSRPLVGLVMLSGARVTASEWAPRMSARRGLPVFMSHGRSDADLAFDASEALAGDLARAGLEVTWVPFDGGHETPLLVLRALKRFLAKHATERAVSSK